MIKKLIVISVKKYFFPIVALVINMIKPVFFKIYRNDVFKVHGFRPVEVNLKL